MKWVMNWCWLWIDSRKECGITGRKYTYDKVRDLSRRFGSALVRMGFKRGEVLGMVLPNLPEFPIAMLGAAGIGMPVTTVNPIYTAGCSFHLSFNNNWVSKKKKKNN